ncbi:hypothetical protein E2P81_ATG02524 [Venturia nashicola]|nr:hypothetical protein E2P81_ATG02524 [Venturia nashicola]
MKPFSQSPCKRTLTRLELDTSTSERQGIGYARSRQPPQSQAKGASHAGWTETAAKGCNSEILDCIAGFLSLEDLRSLRLVNGTMYNATIHSFVHNHLKFQTVEFTFRGLQRLVDISKHLDLSKTVLFGSGIRFVSFTHAVWSEKEASIWCRAIFKSKSLYENRGMVEGALKARKLWRSHEKMLSRDLYLSMLTTFFQSIKGSGQFIGFNFLDLTPKHYDVNLQQLSRPGAIGETCADGQTGWVYLPTGLERTTRFALIMEMCFHAMRATNTSLLQGFRRPGPDFQYVRHHITLRHLTSIMDRHEATPGSFPPWQFLERSTVLKLSFAAINRSEMVSLDDQRSITRLITPMSQTLTCLSLHTTYCSGVLYNIIHELAQNVLIPRLKNLTLDRGTANYKDLMKLITKHSNSLETIHLQFLALSYDSWSNVFLTLANTTMPTLDELWIRYIVEADILQAGNGTFTAHGMRRVTWPVNRTTNNSATYARMHDAFGGIDDMTSDDLLLLMPHTPYFQHINPFGLVGAQRLHEMVARMAYEDM